MKRYLLGTSALVAAGMLVSSGTALAQANEEPIQISVNGYMAQFLSYTSQDDRAPTNLAGIGGRVANSGRAGKFQENPEAEIHFNGRSTLANGITVSMRIELEGNTSGDQIDETWMALEGAFGRLQMGSYNAVNYVMSYKAPDLWPRGGNFTNEGYVVGNLAVGTTGSPIGDSSFGATASRFFDNDAQKVSYYTPRWAGFQAGASYTPDSRQDNFGTYGKDVAYTNGWAIAANFVRTFGAFDVAAYAGYQRWSGPDIAVGGVSVSQPNPDQFSLGLQLGYAGFRIGGGYGRISDGRGTGGTGTNGAASTAGTSILRNDGRAWDIGAQYTWGAAGVSLTYFRGKNDDSPTSGPSFGDDKLSILALTGIYKIGPGMTFNVTGFTSKQIGNGSGGNAIAGNASIDDNKASGVITGLTLIF
ncbi:MAG: porin [Proteobacteria bacterium]|nr:porin [Pseudomonadota bacterium]